MTSFKSYSRVIFGRNGKNFGGVDQSFDPHAEAGGEVPYSMDVEYTNEKIRKRDGYEKFSNFVRTSILQIGKVDFLDIDHSIAVCLGDGEIYHITDL